MWDPREFEQHWRAEFPGEEAPVMQLSSADDMRQELERCKENLRRLQQVLAGEKFKVAYLETALCRQQKPVPRQRSKVPPPPPPKRVSIRDLIPPPPPALPPPPPPVITAAPPAPDPDYEDKDGATESFVLENLLSGPEEPRTYRLPVPAEDSPRISSPEPGSNGYLSSDREDDDSIGKRRIG